VSFRRGKLSKRATTDEYSLVNKEINNSILVDAMGLKSHYQNSQQNLTKNAAGKSFLYKKMLQWGKIIPKDFAVNLFPFLILVFFPNIILGSIYIVYRVLNDCV
jgi:hypothetical protein